MTTPFFWHKADSTPQQYYLNHNYKNEWDGFGSVFVDYRSTKGTDGKNLVLHSHHIQDGSMFGDLMKFGGTTGISISTKKFRPSVLTLQRAKVLIRLSPCSRQTLLPHTAISSTT